MPCQPMLPFGLPVVTGPLGCLKGSGALQHLTFPHIPEIIGESSGTSKRTFCNESYLSKALIIQEFHFRC